MLTLDKLQAEVKEWQEYNFPDSEPFYPLLGIQEEVGELSHAHLKLLQGIRGTPEQHELAKRDAIGDILVYMADYCNRHFISMQDCLTDTWNHVKQRDWQKDKQKGGIESNVKE